MPLVILMVLDCVPHFPLVHSCAMSLADKSPQRYIEDQAYVLQLRPYRETSLLAELFTQTHGSITAVAKGAKRMGSPLRETLLVFQPLHCRWSGTKPIKTMTYTERVGGLPYLKGRSLLCGYYANELILLTCAKEDPIPEVFNAYHNLMSTLSTTQMSKSQSHALRIFEWQLLQSIGLMPDLNDLSALQGADWAVYDPMNGTFRPCHSHAATTVSVSALMALQDNEIHSGHLNEYKNFFHQILLKMVGANGFKTRQVFSDLLE